jgi:hypothetical protein
MGIKIIVRKTGFPLTNFLLRRSAMARPIINSKHTENTMSNKVVLRVVQNLQSKIASLKLLRPTKGGDSRVAIVQL